LEREGSMEDVLPSLFFFALISTMKSKKRGKKGHFANYTLQKGIITYMI